MTLGRGETWGSAVELLATVEDEMRCQVLANRAGEPWPFSMVDVLREGVRMIVAAGLYGVTVAALGD